MPRSDPRRLPPSLQSGCPFSSPLWLARRLDLFQRRGSSNAPQIGSGRSEPASRLSLLAGVSTVQPMLPTESVLGPSSRFVEQSLVSLLESDDTRTRHGRRSSARGYRLSADALFRASKVFRDSPTEDRSGPRPVKVSPGFVEEFGKRKSPSPSWPLNRPVILVLPSSSRSDSRRPGAAGETLRHGRCPARRRDLGDARCRGSRVCRQEKVGTHAPPPRIRSIFR